MSDKLIDWRKQGVKRDRRFESLILVLSSGQTTVFQHLKDIMVFAAMVGFSSGTRRSLNSNDTISIILDTYSTDNKDSFIYLLAMMENKNAVCLKDENLAESIKIFEEYCNSGLYIIEGWRDENPADDITDIILNKIYEKLEETHDTGLEVDNSSLELKGF